MSAKAKPENMTQELSALNKSEADRLADLEATISRGKKMFWEVGMAYAEIRDARLYRSTHSSFKEYCQDVWRLSETYANRLICSAEVVENFKPTPIGVASESIAREFARLDDPEQQRKVALDLGMDSPESRITAKEVRAVVDALIETPDERSFEDTRDTITLSLWHCDITAVKRALWAFGFKGGEGNGAHLRLGKEGMTQKGKEYYVNSRTGDAEEGKD